MANAYTAFPENVQTFDLKTDISTDVLSAMTQYNNYILAGNFTSASALKDGNLALQKAIIDSVYLNKMTKTLEEVQQMFLNNIQQYIREVVRGRGTWSATVKYSKYDFVSYTVNTIVQTYQCLNDSTPIGTLPTNTTYWITRVIQGEKGASGLGLTPRGIWTTSTQYYTNDFVVHNNSFWQALSNNSSSTPTTTNTSWLLLLNFTGLLTVLLDDHNKNIGTEAGAHGIRYYQSKLQYKDSNSTWSNIDVGSGGSYVGSTAPTDTKLLWIDTGNNGIMKYYNGTSWVTVKAVWG